MSVTKLETSKFITDLLKTALGVKDVVVQKIDVSGLVNTCFSTSTLLREDTLLKGYRLEDYKLDPRLKNLVLPRGVYIDEKRLALNLLKSISDIEIDKVLSPTDFMYVQTQLFGATRKSDNLSENLEVASASLTLSEAGKRISAGDKCHYEDIPYLPLELNSKFYDDIYLNFEVSDMLKEFIRRLMVDLKA